MADDKKGSNLLERLAAKTGAGQGKQLGAGQSGTKKAAVNKLIGRLAGGNEESRQLLLAGKVDEAAAAEAASTVVEVYFISDATGSMYSGIKEVRDHIGMLGPMIFRDGAFTRVSVTGFYDHGLNQGLGVEMSPLTPLTADKSKMTHALKKQLVELRDHDPHYNTDWVENGECALREVVRAIRTSEEAPHTEYAGKTVKRVIVNCMETPMHGQLEQMARDRENPLVRRVLQGFTAQDVQEQITQYGGWGGASLRQTMKGHLRDAPEEQVRRVLQFYADNHDNGCYQNVNWKTALDAAKMQSSEKGGQFFLVDCDGHFGAQLWCQAAKQVCINPDKEGEHYVKLGGMTDVMPTLLGGLIEAGRGLASTIVYVQEVERTQGAQAAEKVTKMLPVAASLTKYGGGTPQKGGQ